VKKGKVIVEKERGVVQEGNVVVERRQWSSREEQGLVEEFSA
jgi:hypothetical protein